METPGGTYSKMAMAGMEQLTVAAIKNTHQGKHFDGGGLFLLVKPNGARYWRLKYRRAGKEKMLALGVFPEVNLAEARKRRDDARATLRDGVDPGNVKRATKAAAKTAAANSFSVIAAEWLTTQKARLVPSTYTKAQWMLDELVGPWLGGASSHL